MLSEPQIQVQDTDRKVRYKINPQKLSTLIALVFCIVFTTLSSIRIRDAKLDLKDVCPDYVPDKRYSHPTIIEQIIAFMIMTLANLNYLTFVGILTIWHKITTDFIVFSTFGFVIISAFGHGIGVGLVGGYNGVQYCFPLSSTYRFWFIIMILPQSIVGTGLVGFILFLIWKHILPTLKYIIPLEQY